VFLWATQLIGLQTTVFKKDVRVRVNKMEEIIENFLPYYTSRGDKVAGEELPNCTVTLWQFVENLG
jgi:hypothetical protein